MKMRRLGWRSRGITTAVGALAVLLVVAWLALWTGAAAEAWRMSPQKVDVQSFSVPQRLTVAAQGSQKRSSGGDASVPLVTLDSEMSFTMLGLTCDLPKDDGDVIVRLRCSEDGSGWGPWFEAPLEYAGEGDGAPTAHIEAMWTGAGRYVQIRATAAGDSAPVELSGVKLVALDTSPDVDVAERTLSFVRTLAATAPTLRLTASAGAATVDEPDLVTRAAWGADESLRSGDPVLATVKMAFIHHTAGGNDYSQADAPAIVRGIYAYHTKSLGWSDIGYNFLIDRFGRIYVGRAGGPKQGVVGAQVYGFNTGSTGISVMGTYTSEQPSAQAVDALERLLAWKLSLHGVDPTGQATLTCGGTDKYDKGDTVTFPTIAGHRDANYTACPGDALYALLPEVRASVAAAIGEQSTATDPWTVALKTLATPVEVGTSVTYSGSVATAAGSSASGTVTIQKRLAAGGDWINWRTAKLAADGSYAVSVAMVNRQNWEFRAMMPADSANLVGYSSVVPLTVGTGERTTPVTTTEATLFTVSGRGWGHGIGMSQWGAYGLAKHGASYKTILKHYYTGIGFTTIKNATLRVRLRSGLQSVKLTCASSYTAKGGGSSLSIGGGVTATTTYVNGAYRVSAGGKTKTFSGAVTFAPTKGQLSLITATDAGQTGRHRGKIRVVRSGSSLMMVNYVAMESYLRGVVPHEVSASWPAEALKAQACAARSYAERARRAATGEWDVYCDVRSQVYSGVSREDSRTNAAIKATAGIVPSYKGTPIQAFYFSCSGGQTENIEYAWETTSQPYLKGVDDPYDSYATLHTWGPFTRSEKQLKSALGSAVKGTVQAIYRVEKGSSPRIVKAAIIGSNGTTYMHGSMLRTKLGLNSTWVTFKSMSISPAAGDDVSITKGTGLTIEGRVYPALSSGSKVQLYTKKGGVWSSQSVATTRHSQSLSGGYVAKYSSYQVTVKPTATSVYYFKSGSAKSPQTTIQVSN
ncbi:MAG: SpoIID/LytB domain-containing protein [Thermoleophilia bacterium]